jgi:hypothetical protein
MQDRQTVGLDLPPRVGVGGPCRGVWATYDDPHWLATRHELGEASAGAVEATPRE